MGKKSTVDTLAADVMAILEEYQGEVEKLNAETVKPLVRCHTTAFKENLNDVLGKSHLNLFTDQVERDRILVKPVTDEIIVTDCLLPPYRRFIRVLRQR